MGSGSVLDATLTLGKSAKKPLKRVITGPDGQTQVVHLPPNSVRETSRAIRQANALATSHTQAYTTQEQYRQERLAENGYTRAAYEGVFQEHRALSNLQAQASQLPQLRKQLNRASNTGATPDQLAQLQFNIQEATVADQRLQTFAQQSAVTQAGGLEAYLKQSAGLINKTEPPEGRLLSPNPLLKTVFTTIAVPRKDASQALTDKRTSLWVSRLQTETAKPAPNPKMVAGLYGALPPEVQGLPQFLELVAPVLAPLMSEPQQAPTIQPTPDSPVSAPSSVVASADSPVTQGVSPTTPAQGTPTLVTFPDEAVRLAQQVGRLKVQPQDQVDFVRDVQPLLRQIDQLVPPQHQSSLFNIHATGE
jgi:hypothetical protein